MRSDGRYPTREAERDIDGALAPDQGIGAGGEKSRYSLLMMEKTNSDSPNQRTPKMLMAHVQMQMAAVYAA